MENEARGLLSAAEAHDLVRLKIRLGRLSQLLSLALPKKTVRKTKRKEGLND
jgi:hypothetical protein